DQLSPDKRRHRNNLYAGLDLPGRYEPPDRRREQRRIAGGPNTECSIAARTGRHVHDRSHWLAHVRIDAIGDKADDFHRSLYDVAWPDRYPSSDRTLAVEVHAGECGIDDADAGDGFVAFVDLRCDVTGTKVASLTYV